MSPKTSSDIKLSPATISVHGGERTDEQQFGAVVSPVFHSATFAFENFAEMRRYARDELPEACFYSRYGNPTVAEAERKIAELEGTDACVVTSSGSAATFCALVTLCEAGDEVIACDSVYGGTVKILTKVLSRFGISSRFITLDDIANLAELSGERSRVFWFESPANPLNRIVAVQGGEPEVEKLFDALQLVRTAPSLGGVETLASYPLYSSHASFSDEQLKAAGVSPATGRFAVGIGAAEDIIADITQALEKI